MEDSAASERGEVMQGKPGVDYVRRSSGNIVKKIKTVQGPPL